MQFTIGIPQERDDYVADVFHDGDQWAEVRRESNGLHLVVFPRRCGSDWDIPLADVLAVLQQVRRRFAELQGPP